MVEGGTDHMIASESVALQSFGCQPEDNRDLLPGEAVIIVKGSKPEFRPGRHVRKPAFIF